MLFSEKIYCAVGENYFDNVLCPHGYVEMKESILFSKEETSTLPASNLATKNFEPHRLLEMYYFYLTIEEDLCEETPSSIFSTVQEREYLFFLPEIASVPQLDTYIVGSRYLTYHLMYSTSDENGCEKLTGLLSSFGQVEFKKLGLFSFERVKEATENFSRCVLAASGKSFEELSLELLESNSSIFIEPSGALGTESFCQTSEVVSDTAQQLGGCDDSSAVNECVGEQAPTYSSAIANIAPSLKEDGGRVESDEAVKSVASISQDRSVTLPAISKSTIIPHEPMRAQKLDGLFARVSDLLFYQTKLYNYVASKQDNELHDIITNLHRLGCEVRDSALDMRMVALETYVNSMAEWLYAVFESDFPSVSLNFHATGLATQLDSVIASEVIDAVASYLYTFAQVSNSELDSFSVRIESEYVGSEVTLVLSHSSASVDATDRGCLAELQAKLASVHGTMAVGDDGANVALKISLPITNAIVDGLLVQSGEEQYIIPMSQVVDCVECNSRMGISTDGNMITVGGDSIPYVQLSEMIGTRGAFRNEQCIVVQSLAGMYGILVDCVLGEVQTTIKPLGALYKHLPVFSGVSVTANEPPCLVVNMVEMQAVAGLL